MKKNILKLLSILVIGFMCINVNAREFGLADEKVVQEGEYDSVRMIAGREVTNKAKIDGMSLGAGYEVTASGKSEVGLYAGNTVEISEEVSKDLFAAGNDVTITKDAKINRDVFIAANKVTVSTSLNRDAYIAADTVILKGVTVSGDATIYARKIVFDEETSILGTLTYSDDTTIENLNKATIGSTNVVKNEEIKKELAITFKTRVINFTFSTLTSYITMLVLLLLLPKLRKRLSNPELGASLIIKNMAIGLGLLFFVPIVCILALVTRVLVPLSLISLCIYLFSLYLAVPFASYLIGNLITTKLFKLDNMYLALIIGVLLIKLLALIPTIGIFIGFITFIYGLGLILDSLIYKDKE